MAADLRERVARAIAKTYGDPEGMWERWLPEADAVLAELGPELAPTAYHWDGVNPPVPIAQQPQASAEASPQAEPVAWRVFKFTGSWKCADERWEVYSPDGSGGAVNESDVLDENVRALLDAMAATPQPQAACSGCNGRGEIGGVMGDGSFQTDPCPWCAAPQPQASAEDVDLVALWCEGIEDVEAAWKRIRAQLETK